MATVRWTSTRPTPNVIIATAVLNGGDTTDELTISNFADKTVHVYGGTFGTSTVTLVGSNVAGGTGLNLHQSHDTSTTFAALAAATLAHMLENPFALVASASAGSGTGLTVKIVGYASSK